MNFFSGVHAAGLNYQGGYMLGLGLGPMVLGSLTGAGASVVAEGLGGLDSLSQMSLFRRGGVEDARLIASIDRVSSNVANEPFNTPEAIAAGWKLPYPENIMIREVAGSKNIGLVRVHTDPAKPIGGFLVREKVLASLNYDPAKIQHYLGLPDTPLYISDVNVPAGTKLYVGRIGAQPNFGLLSESGFQYQLAGIIPRNNFANTRLLEPLVDENTSFFQPNGG